MLLYILKYNIFSFFFFFFFLNIISIYFFFFFFSFLNSIIINRCGIDDAKCNSDDDSCGAAAIGYPCCENTCTEVYTDEYRWGVENNDWCGLKDSC